jgi:hypothetical protein
MEKFISFLIKRDGGTGPVKSQQQAKKHCANSSKRKKRLEDEGKWINIQLFLYV